MSAYAAEIVRLWDELDRVRAVLKSLEWSGLEVVYYDGCTAACCPACGGFRPGEHTCDKEAQKQKSHFGHFDNCALVAALAPPTTQAIPKKGNGE